MKPPRTAAPKARDALTKQLHASAARRKGKPRAPFEGTVWQFLTAINEIPIKVRLAQSAADTDDRR